MFRALKNWMSGVVLFALIAAQVAPASALIISFQTSPAPLTILSSTITPEQTGLNFTGVGQIWQVNFSYTLDASMPDAGRVGLYRASDDVEMPSSHFQGQSNMWGGAYDNHIGLGLTTTNELAQNTRYYIQFSGMVGQGGTGYLNSADPTTALYFYSAANNGTYRVYFTTALPTGWEPGSTFVNGGNNGQLTGGQNGVPVVNALIKVTSSNLLQSSTVNTTTVSMHEGSAGGTVVTCAVSLDVDNKTIIMAPGGTLNYSTWYYLVLTGVTDTTGTVLP